MPHFAQRQTSLFAEEGCWNWYKKSERIFSGAGSRSGTGKCLEYAPNHPAGCAVVRFPNQLTFRNLSFKSGGWICTKPPQLAWLCTHKQLTRLHSVNQYFPRVHHFSCWALLNFQGAKRPFWVLLVKITHPDFEGGLYVMWGKYADIILMSYLIAFKNLTDL